MTIIETVRKWSWKFRGRLSKYITAKMRRFRAVTCSILSGSIWDYPLQLFTLNNIMETRLYSWQRKVSSKKRKLVYIEQHQNPRCTLNKLIWNQTRPRALAFTKNCKNKLSHVAKKWRERVSWTTTLQDIKYFSDFDWDSVVQSIKWHCLRPLRCRSCCANENEKLKSVWNCLTLCLDIVITFRNFRCKHPRNWVRNTLKARTLVGLLYLDRNYHDHFSTIRDTNVIENELGKL